MEPDDPIGIFMLVARAIMLRDNIYYNAQLNSDIEGWANELGGVLSNLVRKLGETHAPS
jgi:hypothetical protein